MMNKTVLSHVRVWTGMVKMTKCNRVFVELKHLCILEISLPKQEQKKPKFHELQGNQLEMLGTNIATSGIIKILNYI